MTTIVGLLLKPLDVLLFRDARPFEAGDTGRTQWPTPATFAGLLRTHLMQQAGIRPEQLHGLHAPPRAERHWFGRLRFRGPWLYVECPDSLQRWHRILIDVDRSDRSESSKPRDQQVALPVGPLMPAPADLVRLANDGGDPVKRLRPLERDGLPGWDPPCTGMAAMWLTGDSAKAKPVDGYIDHRSLQQYLKGENLAAADIHDLKTFAVRDARTGIGIDPERLTADQDRGLIYSALFWRLLPGVCFYGELDWPEDAPHAPALDDALPSGLVLPWGGERRGVIVERAAPFDWQSLGPTAPNGNLLTLLVTPGVFSNGTHRWKPADQGTLRAACVPKPLPISGWDLAGVAENNHQPRPRPTRFAAPAGSVYLWTRGTRNADTPIATGLRSLCDRPQDADNGWGLALSGIWKPCSFD